MFFFCFSHLISCLLFFSLGGVLASPVKPKQRHVTSGVSGSPIPNRSGATSASVALGVGSYPAGRRRTRLRPPDLEDWKMEAPRNPENGRLEDGSSRIPEIERRGYCYRVGLLGASMLA